MKKLLIFIFAFLFTSNIFATSSQLTVLNATTNYTLYFNTVTKWGACYHEYREYNYTGVSGYNILAPAVGGSSMVFSNYTGLQSYYGTGSLYMTRKISSTAPPTGTSIGLVDIYMNSVSGTADWAYIIYKVSNSSGYTEGTYLGFYDYYSCHHLDEVWGEYGATATESFTTFTIGGGPKYFVVGEF